MTESKAGPRRIRILAVSDQIDPRIHSASLRERMSDIDLVFGCGDVPARYLEFLADALDRPVYFVLGNHVEELVRKGLEGTRYEPMGCIDLGGKTCRDERTGLLLAGFPGSPRYSRDRDQQYSNREIWSMMIRMTPRLLLNRIRYGRALDVLVTHSPPRHVNDREDVPHRGFPALRTFLCWFKPAIQVHGHIHIYDRGEVVETPFHDSIVINVYPFRRIELDAEPNARAMLIRGSDKSHG
ncbi:MAG TPA: metallophosphoesterase [Thermomicrobiales bacterium]|nr:metallophosphoesterase [Thermomicrobiales bacterium]